MNSKLTVASLAVFFGFVAHVIASPAQAGAASAPTIRGVSLIGVPQRDDITTIAELYEPSPANPGESRQKARVFFMSLGEVGPWLYHAAGMKHFYLEVRPDAKVVKDVVYGPIDGHPAEKLDLAGWLNESPTHPDPGYARRVARDMLATGDGPLASLALKWLGDFKAPSPPDEHRWLIAAIEKYLTDNPQSPATDQARTVLARLSGMAATAAAEWEKERTALSDESYGNGEPLEKLTVSVEWSGPAANGLRLGLAGLGKNEKWRSGSEHAVEIYLRNDGNEPVKFSWTPRADEGLSLLLTDEKGATHHASIVMWSGLLIHNHCRLDPGHFLKLKPDVNFRVIKTNPDGTNPQPATGRNAFLVEKAGTYRFEASCDIGLTDWADSQGNKRLRPAGEWEGVLTTTPMEVVVDEATR
jgi:hypothetical protein